jgi:hypothetical protein
MGDIGGTKSGPFVLFGKGLDISNPSEPAPLAALGGMLDAFAAQAKNHRP